jgi:alkaline phosphatase D
MELVLLDERQYRANQPCGDALAFPCSSWDRQRTILGRRQLGFLEGRLQASPAAWKVVGGQSLIMPNRVHDGEFARFDSWQGYPQEREQLLSFIRDKGIRDVVFITGDIHTFLTGDVRTNMGEGETVAIEVVGGSITSQSLGETDIPVGGITLTGNDAHPKTDPAIIAALRGINPWVKGADFDHHGFAQVKASQDGFDCELVRLETIKKRSRATLPPSADFKFSVKRGQKSLLS